ncbi:MAG: hypothetical protein J5762_07760 [Clostridia bacterium]|nr:hypothetical protein [Clostridia bacterium]
MAVTSENIQTARCFAPVYDKNSKVLLLGTVPSFDSVKFGFYYMNKANYFWRLLSDVTDRDFISLADNVRKKLSDANAKSAVNELIALLLDCKIALFDTIAECERVGSTDDKILSSTLNDAKKITEIIKNSSIKKIFCTSGEALRNLVRIFGGKVCAEKSLSLITGSEDVPFDKLLSPSRRARQTYFERLSDWQKLKKYL